MPIHKVLVVDDSPTERMFLAEILTTHGYEVSLAEDGAEALERIRTQAPDLILMDVVMPGRNGFQLTRQISKDPATQHIPIVMCTSKKQQTDRIWGLRQGARDYLMKPIQAEELIAKINALA